MLACVAFKDLTEQENLDCKDDKGDKDNHEYEVTCEVTEDKD